MNNRLVTEKGAETMKKLVLLVAAMVLAGSLAPTALQAGDREWATAGKILTGIVAAQVLLGGAPQSRCNTVVVEQPAYPVYTEIRYYPAPVYHQQVYAPPVYYYYGNPAPVCRPAGPPSCYRYPAYAAAGGHRYGGQPWQNRWSEGRRAEPHGRWR